MKSLSTVPEISNSIIIERILKDSDQFDLLPIDLQKIDELLKIVSYDFDFKKFIDPESKSDQLELRGILDIRESSIYLDQAEKLVSRKRFSHAHEIGHYLIPNHRDYFYQCSESDMNVATLNLLEREANQFASELLFKGSIFKQVLEENRRITFNSVGNIAEAFNVSFVASLRKVITETSQPAAMVIISEKDGGGEINYTISSQSMRDKYFSEISNIPSLPQIIEKSRLATRRDPHRIKLKSANSAGEKVILTCQFYFNGYQHVGLIRPEVNENT